MDTRWFDVVVLPHAVTCRVALNTPKRLSKSTAGLGVRGWEFVELPDVIRLVQVAMTQFLQKRMSRNMGEN